MPGTMTPRTDKLLAELADETSETLTIARLCGLARELETDLTAAPRTSVIPQAARIVAAAEDAMNAAKEIVRLMEAAPAEHEQRLAAAHAESEGLRTDRDQLAAARLQIANLHAALKEAREGFLDDSILARIDAALAESESTWLPLIADIRALADGAWMFGNIDVRTGEVEAVEAAAKRVLAVIGSDEADYGLFGKPNE